MEKHQNQKRLIEILNYLWEHTDKAEYVTIVQLQKHLETLGMRPDRKTLMHDLDALAGISWLEITCERSVQNRYFISRRFFDEADVKILSDAVRSSYFISERNGKELVEKLKQFVGPSSKGTLDTPSFLDASIKTKNNNVIRNANRISKAIAAKKQITFKYYDYTVERKKEHKHDKKYAVSPYAMVINDGKYYIAAWQDDEAMVKTFRVDKIDALAVSSIDAVPAPKSFSAKKFAAQTRMFSGHESEIELLCDADVMFGILDKFGTKVQTEKVDEGHFKATVTADISPTFFGWVLGYGGKIKIISPKNVVDDYEKTAGLCVK